MAIIISQLKRPGEILDTSKLSILGATISKSIQVRTNHQYIAKSTIEGRTIKITLKQYNKQTGKYANTIKSEQNILAGRISIFLNGNNITHEIKVQ